MSAHTPGERWHVDGGIVKGDRADMYPPLFEAVPGTDDGAIVLAAAAPELLDALRELLNAAPLPANLIRARDPYLAARDAARALVRRLTA